MEIVKERETIGYAYETADASFELLARRTLGSVPNYFDVTQFDVNVEQRNNARGERVTVTMAVVKVKIGDDNVISAAEGNGPVNALDSRCARTSASTRNISTARSSPTTACASSIAAPARSPAC